MIRYQLMGRKKVALRSKIADSYPPIHILSLPYEILVEIFSYLSSDIKTLLKLALVCSKINVIINKLYLYKHVVFKSPSHFEIFSQCHLPALKTSFARKLGLNESSSKINYIQSVHFINPPPKDSSKIKTNIAGSYNVESDVKNSRGCYSVFIDSFKSLLNEAYGLKVIQISEISPQFTFPKEIVNYDPNSFSSHFKRPKPTRTLPKLVLKGQSGWSLPFKSSHVSSIINVYDNIENLTLSNFVINEAKPAEYAVPKPILIGTLNLVSCLYLDPPNKHPAKKPTNGLFSNTSTLQLINIQTGNDLSTIDFIKLNGNLTRLILDFGSRIFYELNDDAADKHFCFSKYNNFFKLICSGQGGYATLKELVLINFDLFDSYGHTHNIRELSEHEQGDDWIETPTDRFYKLLGYLSHVPNLTIILKDRPAVVHKCVKCGFTTGDSGDPTSDPRTVKTLNSTEWSILLKSLLTGNEECNVKILDHTLNPVYIRTNEEKI